MAAELCLTIAYVGLAFVLKNTLKFDIRQFRLPDVVAFLLLIPAGAALSAFIYCGVLYLGGELSSDKVFVAMVHCWIGDALGIVTIIPATTAAFTYSSPPWRWSGYTLFTIFIFVLGIGLGFAALVGVGDKLYYLFNLLFLPVIWVAMREGYAGVALALVTIQLTLAVLTAFVGYNTTDFAILQLLMLVLSITGLLLGAVTTERQDAALRLREQKRELARMVSNARAGAMGMALAHEVSQPLSTVATYLHAARRLLQSSVCERASHGCADQGGGRGSAGSRGSGAHSGFRLKRQFELDRRSMCPRLRRRSASFVGRKQPRAAFKWRLKASVPSLR